MNELQRVHIPYDHLLSSYSPTTSLLSSLMFSSNRFSLVSPYSVSFISCLLYLVLYIVSYIYYLYYISYLLYYHLAFDRSLSEKKKH